MPTKTILILANSLKKGGRCIAGREVLWFPDGRWRFGPWIRPVSAHGDGELAHEETIRPDGSQVQVLEFANVALAQNQHEECQPENWVIAGPRCWSKLDRPCKLPPMPALEEHPPDLWIDKAELNDRISPERLAELRPGFSLAVIRPDELTLAWHAEMNTFKKRPQNKFRARFTYNGLKYELSLTDPLASERFCTPMPSVGEKPRTLTLQSPHGPMLCVSLTPVFSGFHYKVAATILGYD
jgi:hypothetical protein